MIMTDSINSSAGSIIVLMADSNSMRAKLLADALQKKGAFHIETCPAEVDSVDASIKNSNPDIVLLRVTGNRDASAMVDLLQKAGRLTRSAKFILLTETSDVSLAIAAFRAGARGFFSEHEQSLKLLQKCISCVQQGQFWIANELLSEVMKAFSHSPLIKLPSSPRAESLTARETEVMHLVIDGLSNKDVASSLGISENTVKKYLYTVFNKLGVSTRVELVLQAFHLDAKSPQL
jgi:DNA-binding NarL/FixJ family response regulator